MIDMGLTLCVNGCGRWSQGRRYGNRCRQCFHSEFGSEDPQLAREMAAATLALEEKAFAVDTPQPTRVIRTRVIDGVEYDVTFDGT